jgi:transcriptional regulator with GAF, ATPase, and Fis domain
MRTEQCTSDEPFEASPIDPQTQTTVIEREPSADASGSIPSLRLYVVYSKDDSAPVSVPLRIDQPLLVGRDVSPEDLIVRDSRMSRLHFRIAFDRRQGLFRVGDAHSSNGTRLNGVPLQSAILGGGDVLRAGSTLFVVDDPRAIDTARERAERIAPTNLRVLLTGESGVGKEVFARRIHEASGRKGPFVAVNCASLPRELAPAELFGHRKGAFSGAISARPGLFLAAHHGTLLLDEVAELPLNVQPVLLRAIEEGTVRRVGADTEVPTDVRLIAATNVPVQDLAEGESFRGDLFARIAQSRIVIPPLRQRRSEIIPLARGFARALGSQLALSVDAAEMLLRWHWPHNVRELKSLVESFVSTQTQGVLLDHQFVLQEFPHMLAGLQQIAAQGSSASSSNCSPLTNRKSLLQLLDRFDGNVTRTATHLGVQRSQVYRWMKRLSIRR